MNSSFSDFCAPHLWVGDPQPNWDYGCSVQGGAQNTAAPPDINNKRQGPMIAIGMGGAAELQAPQGGEKTGGGSVRTSFLEAGDFGPRRKV